MNLIHTDYAHRAQGRPRARPRAEFGLTPAGWFWLPYMLVVTFIVGFSVGYGYGLEIFARAW